MACKIDLIVLLIFTQNRTEQQDLIPINKCNGKIMLIYIICIEKRGRNFAFTTSQKYLSKMNRYTQYYRMM